MHTVTATTPASVAFLAQANNQVLVERQRAADDFLTSFAVLEYERASAQLQRLGQQTSERAQLCIEDGEFAAVMADFHCRLALLVEHQEIKSVIYHSALALASQYAQDPQEVLLRSLEQLIEELRH